MVKNKKVKGNVMDRYSSALYSKKKRPKTKKVLKADQMQTRIKQHETAPYINRFFK